MERVAFLIEPHGERISCLLNPESLTVRRLAGVRPRRTRGGALAGAGLSDDPLEFTGGGTTEIELALLFDVSLAGTTIQTEDVRDLTRPLWQLAENAPRESGYATPPIVRFVWGKAWNIPSVIAGIAERLDGFAASGAPRQSWLRMRLLRVNEPVVAVETAAPIEGGPSLEEQLEDLEGGEEEGGGQTHEWIGDGPPAAGAGDLPPQGDRLDQLAWRYYGDARGWRWIAYANDLTDPLTVEPGRLLKIPDPPTGTSHAGDTRSG